MIGVIKVVVFKAVIYMNHTYYVPKTHELLLEFDPWHLPASCIADYIGEGEYDLFCVDEHGHPVIDKQIKGVALFGKSA